MGEHSPVQPDVRRPFPPGHPRLYLAEADELVQQYGELRFRFGLLQGQQYGHRFGSQAGSCRNGHQPFLQPLHRILRPRALELSGAISGFGFAAPRRFYPLRQGPQVGLVPRSQPRLAHQPGRIYEGYRLDQRAQAPRRYRRDRQPGLLQLQVPDADVHQYELLLQRRVDQFVRTGFQRQSRPALGAQDRVQRGCRFLPARRPYRRYAGLLLPPDYRPALRIQRSGSSIRLQDALYQRRIDQQYGCRAFALCDARQDPRPGLDRQSGSCAQPQQAHFVYQRRVPESGLRDRLDRNPCRSIRAAAYRRREPRFVLRTPLGLYGSRDRPRRA